MASDAVRRRLAWVGTGRTSIGTAASGTYRVALNARAVAWVSVVVGLAGLTVGGF